MINNATFNELRIHLKSENPILDRSERLAAIEIIIDHWQNTNFKKNIKHDPEKEAAYIDDLQSQSDFQLMTKLSDIGWH